MLGALFHSTGDSAFPAYSASSEMLRLRRLGARPLLARSLLALHAAPALRRACSSGGATASASQAPHVAAEAVRDLGSVGHDYSRAAEDQSTLGEGVLVEIDALIRKRLDAITASRWAEAEEIDLELRSRYEVTVRHRAREWRADHGGARLPPFKVLGSAGAVDGAEVLAKVRLWAAAVEAKEPQGARLIRAELGREGVELFPWRFDAAAADLQTMPSDAELQQLTAKVRYLVITPCPRPHSCSQGHSK